MRLNKRFLICIPGFMLAIQIFSQIPNAPRFVAEWEPAWGTLIRWPLGIPAELVVELASDDSLYVLVESYYQKDQAINAFSSWGVNLDHCRFLFAQTYSHWTRDWGPHYVFNDQGVAGIADPVFNGYPWVPGCNSNDNIYNEKSQTAEIFGWEEDDAVNIALADSFNCPLISLPIYLTGGNVMVDGHLTAISTQQMLDENFPAVNEDNFKKIAQDSLGISNYIIVDNPEVYGIQHIDCYAKYLDEETILVKQVDPWHPEYECCEALAEQLGNESNCWGEPYEIIRIYCGSYNGAEVAAYTNSLILNKKILVPLFGISSDETALQTYADAMPGYEVIGFEWNDWYYYDALHCRTMGIFDRHMLRIVHKPLKGELSFSGWPQIVTMIDDRSNLGLVQEELKLYWRENGSVEWNFEPLLPMMQPDSFYAFVPNPVVGKTYEYFIQAADSSGRSETLPRTAPGDLFTFTVIDLTTGIHEFESEPCLFVYPTVFSGETKITLKTNGSANIFIWSMKGELLREWHFQKIHESINVVWTGTDKTGNRCNSGVYFISAQSPQNSFILTTSVILQ